MPKPTSGVQIMSFWGPNGIITKSLAALRVNGDWQPFAAASNPPRYIA